MSRFHVYPLVEGIKVHFACTFLKKRIAHRSGGSSIYSGQVISSNLENGKDGVFGDAEKEH